ncbi:MAG: response regulator [Lachnospiraceae bacterium]|nr:response regulator [Lachnospiraceae bacterium]
MMKDKGLKLKAVFFILCLSLALICFRQDGYAADTQELKTEQMNFGGGYAATGQLSGIGYTTKIYDATNGLPTSDANYILGTKDGYILIGGYSGIIQYDGAEFTRLDTSGGMTSGRGLFEDSKGRIWVGTNDNGVVMMDHGKSVHYTYREGLPSSSIRVFEEDNLENVFIGTTAGVAYVDALGVLHNIDDKRINNERILRLDASPDGTIYGQTKNGCVFKIESCEVSEFYTSEDLGTIKITTLLADSRHPGMVYLGSESNLIYYGQFGDNVAKLKKISAYPAENIHWMCYECNRVWISSSQHVGFLDDNNGYHNIDNLPMNSSIEMMTADYQGNMWFCSSTQGVMKLVSNNFSNVSKNAGIEGSVVNATCLIDGWLYVGTDNGLFVLDKSRKTVKNELTQYIGEARIRSLASDDKGNLWICSYTNDLGLICYSSDKKITSYTTDNGMPNNEIRCAKPASDGTVYACTNGGLAIIKDGKVKRVVDASSGIKNTVFLTVEEGEGGEILIGTDGDGMYIVNGEHIKTIGRDNGLTSDVIMRIKKDEKRGVYWLVTSNSIQYLENGVLTNVTSFPYNNNYDFYFDDNDDMWILSSYGIYSVRADDMINDNVTDYRLYTIANGLTSTPTANSYSALDDKGNLYMAGRDGVCEVNINHFIEESVAVKLGVRSILCNNEEVLCEDNTYTIPADNGRISISPTVLDYTMSDPLVRVYLEGSDDEGITALRSKLTPLEYTGLKYGNYTLHIQVLDNSGKNVLQEETYTVIKKPRAVELVAVRILAVALLALLAGLFVWRIMTGTVIRQQYRQIQEAKDEAERANTAKSRFLANMSHEIRTPINTIMGMDEMILREDATGVPKPYFLSVINYALDIRNASDSLLGLVNNLLDMSKIESGKMNLVEQEYDVEDNIRAIISMIRVKSAEKDLVFNIDIDSNLPVRLYGDSGKIKQVLLNLLTNAVKYTDVGGFTLKISIEDKTDEKCSLKFSVKDTGIGIKPEDMDKLFTAYERLDEVKNSGIQGTGLGLDISRRFVELMNGKLWCESVYGEGSEFIFTLDQKIADDRLIGIFDENKDEGAKGPYIPQFIAPDAEVLVVDDNPMNLNVIRNLLKATKIFVTTASSGEECLEKIKFGSFDVVLLDHMMPGMDGVETLARIRESNPDLPVYALTANATAGEEFYKSKGFNGYLAKPIDSVSLEKTIMKHLPEEIMFKPSRDDAIEDLDELPEDMMWVNEVKELSVLDGIKASGGIVSYITALKMFYDTIESNHDVIEKAYKANNIKLFTVKVHSLKTSARIIGANGLSEMARDLEDAGNHKDMEFIDDNAEKFLSELISFKDKLARLNKKEDDSDKEPISTDELNSAYEALKEVVPQMDYDAVEMILEQLNSYRLPDNDSEIIANVNKMLKVFDWEGIENLIDSREKGE